MGGSSQAQIVFHPDSYFPRSAKLNFTVDVLGASVNLLETAARFEGFETLVEQMFGPEGYFPDERLVQLLKISPTEAVTRGRRSAAEDEMDEIKTNLEKLQDKVKVRSNERKFDHKHFHSGYFLSSNAVQQQSKFIPCLLIIFQLLF